MDMICGCIWDTLGCPSIMSPMASQSDGDTTNNILDRVDLTEEQTLGLFTTYVYIYTQRFLGLFMGCTGIDFMARPRIFLGESDSWISFFCGCFIMGKLMIKTSKSWVVPIFTGEIGEMDVKLIQQDVWI